MSDSLVLDAFGRPYIRDGKLLIDNGEGNLCCCPQCVVTYEALWDCTAQAWVYGTHTVSCFKSGALATDDTWVSPGSSSNLSGYCRATLRHLTGTPCASSSGCTIPTPPDLPEDPPPSAARCNDVPLINSYCWAKLGCKGIYVTFDGVSGSSCVPLYNKYGGWDASEVNGNSYDCTTADTEFDTVNQARTYNDSGCTSLWDTRDVFDILFYTQTKDSVIYLCVRAQMFNGGSHFFFGRTPYPPNCAESIELENLLADPGPNSRNENLAGPLGLDHASIGSGGTAVLTWHS